MKFIKMALLITAFMMLGLVKGKADNIFLWEVNKDDKKFYLFGTTHLPDPELQTLPQKLKDVIDNSQEVRTEIPMNMESQLKVVPLMMRNDGLNLKGILSQNLYKRTEEYLKTINPMLSLEPFNNMKIWTISTIISMLKIQMKYPTLKIIDEQIYNYAQSKNKGVGGVETVEEQANLFNHFSIKEQIIMLDSTLEYLEKNENFVEELKDLYIEGNENKVMIFIENTMFKVEKYVELETKFMEILLYDRNKKMTQSIEILVNNLPKKQYLFAFGVMHFLGEKSIIDKLRSKGYRVDRIKN